MLKTILISQELYYKDNGEVQRDVRRYKVFSDKDYYIKRKDSTTLVAQATCRNEEETSNYIETNISVIRG